MPANVVNCVVTSPPYFWLRDYGVEGQLGKEDSVEEYVSTLTRIMTEVRRVLREDGVLDAFVGSGTTVRVANQMSMSGLGIDLNRDLYEYAAQTLSKDA